MLKLNREQVEFLTQATMRALCGWLVRDPTNDERVQYDITGQGGDLPAAVTA
jgi:hypothetical protein